MNRIVDAQTMAGIDGAAHSDFGFPEGVLMENAGIRAYERAVLILEERRKMVFVVGSGNNGGDALVMARQCLNQGGDPVIILLKADPGGLCGKQLRVCRALGIPIHLWDDDTANCRRLISDAEGIFDGITGTGLSGHLRTSAAQAAEAISQSDGFTFAIDVPSGIGDAFEKGMPAVQADVTLTIELAKRSLYLPAARPLCGRIEIVPIGFPSKLTEDHAEQAVLLEESDLDRLLPEVSVDAYKNSRGWVGVFAGSPGTTGAALLTAEAAARSRAGLVSLYAAPDIFGVVAGRLWSVMPKPWDPESDPETFDMDHLSSLVVGPGWGFRNRMSWLRRFIDSGLPGVLDADGITLLSKVDSMPDLGGRWVLTPHPGEFSRLSGLSKDEIVADPAGTGTKWADRLGCVLVLKGHVTYVCSPDGKFGVVDGMNPAMGTAGSGDLLAGIIGGLLASGADPEAAARAGVLLHSVAGKEAFAYNGWFLAEDLLPYISHVASVPTCVVSTGISVDHHNATSNGIRSVYGYKNGSGNRGDR